MIGTNMNILSNLGILLGIIGIIMNAVLVKLGAGDTAKLGLAFSVVGLACALFVKAHVASMS